LNGEFPGVVANDLLAPAAIRVRGDYVAVAELRGRITILNKTGAVVATLSSNKQRMKSGQTEPSRQSGNRASPTLRTR